MKEMWRVGGARGRQLEMTDCYFCLGGGLFVHTKACSCLGIGGGIYARV
jgi:hypothetical protein